METKIKGISWCIDGNILRQPVQGAKKDIHLRFTQTEEAYRYISLYHRISIDKVKQSFKKETP